MTIGAKRVRLGLPGDSKEVADVKTRSAQLIDLCEDLKSRETVQGAPPNPNSHEINRHWALAQTAYEQASMWAVKALT